MRRLWLILLLVSVSGCVHNQAYHPVPHSVFPPTPVEAPYTLAFIEFDDMGEFWDRHQLDEALTAIKQAKERGHGQAIVVTFVHGWKNNASDDSGNVWGFREQLKQLVGKYQDIPVVGVYIGWRGNVTNVPLFKQFTFYDRRDAAIRIPGASITEALHQVMRTTKLGGEVNKSMCILVGHSFGGMVLERALTQSMVSLINNKEAEKEGGEVEIPTPADLIVFVNSAAPATEAKQFLGMLKARNYRLTVNGQEEPFFLSITSKGDTATGLAMPIGQAPSKITKSMRKYEPLDPKEHPEWPPGVPNQSTYYLHSTANMPILQSHEIVKMNLQQFKLARSEGRVYDSVELRNTDRYCIVKKKERWNDTPYWAMQMPVEFVPDHGQIFRQEFRELLIKFLPKPEEMKQLQQRTLYKAATIK